MIFVPFYSIRVIYNLFYIDWCSPSFSRCSTGTSEKRIVDRTDETVWHGGGVKLLLKCLQSIQCQYYLVFGVVKTVPVQSFARMRYPFCLLISFCYIPAPNYLRNKNGPTTTWRTVIDTYILHLLSLRSFLITYTARARTVCHPSSEIRRWESD